MSDKAWSDHFKDNMNDLGLPTPSTIFDSISSATAMAGTLAALVDKFGTRVTVGELIGAGLLTEKLMVAGGLTAAFYAGAVVGSSAVATGRYFAPDIADQMIAITELARHLRHDYFNSYSIPNSWPQGFESQYSAVYQAAIGQSYSGSSAGGCDISRGPGFFDFSASSSPDPGYYYNPMSAPGDLTQLTRSSSLLTQAMDTFAIETASTPSDLHHIERQPMHMTTPMA